MYLARSLSASGFVGVLLFFLGAILGVVAEEGERRIPKGALAGQVLDAEGKPAADAAVWLLGGSYKEKETQVLEKTNTDSRGRFFFSREKSNYDRKRMRYPRVFARTAAGQLGWETNTWLWQEQRPRQDLRIQTVPTGKSGGRLLDVSGQPIAKAGFRWIGFAIPRGESFQIIELFPGITEGFSFETADDGSFALSPVPKEMKIYAEITAPGYGKCHATWSLANPVIIRLEKAGKVRGRLVAPATGVSLAGILLHLRSAGDRDDKNQAKEAVSLRTYNETTTDEDGGFQFEEVLPGKCCLDLNLYETSLPFTAKPVTELTVKSGEATEVSLPLSPAVEVRGQVVDAETGRGIKGVQVVLYQINEQGSSRPLRCATTDAEGKYVAYAEPGTIKLEPVKIPDEYLRPYYREGGPKRDVKQSMTYPTIKLRPAGTLEGIVTDESGRPVPEAEVQILSPVGFQELVQQETDAEGRFSAKGIDAKKTLGLRARSSVGVSEILEILPAETKSPVRLDLSPHRAATLRGVCVDESGRPIPAIKVGVSTVWMLGSSGIGLGAGSATTDGNGRFEVGNLWPGVMYQVHVNAEGYAKYESRQVKINPGQTHDFGSLTLIGRRNFVEGTVVDSAGEPLTGVRVFNHREAVKPQSTTTDAAGRFRLEGLQSGPVFVFAEKDGYRLAGLQASAKASGLTVTLLRSGEAAPLWKPRRPPNSFAEEQAAARKILEKLSAVPGRGSQSWSYRWMARLDPASALEWSKKIGGQFHDATLHLAAEKIAETDIEDAISLLNQGGDSCNLRTFEDLITRYATSDPAKADRLLEEMIVIARRLDQPERTFALAEAGSWAVRLGKLEAGRKLIEEAAQSAAKMEKSGRGTYYRGLVAGALAPHDFDRAMALLEPVEAGYEKDRGLARIAGAIAPQNLEKALEIVSHLDPSSTLADNTRLRIAYRLAASRPKDALRVVESMKTHGAKKIQAEAYGWLATAIAPADQKMAWSLCDKSFQIYEENAREMRSWSYYGDRGAFSAHVVTLARQIGYPDLGLLIDRALAMRPSDYIPESAGRPAGKNTVFMAEILALVDPESAKHLLETVAPRIDGPLAFGDPGPEARDWYPAWALADLPQAVKFWENHLEAARANPESHLESAGLEATLKLLTTPPAERIPVMDHYIGGLWYPDKEE
jgi:protocatechuate 3,4-dioxygenase beta subunit